MLLGFASLLDVDLARLFAGFSGDGHALARDFQEAIADQRAEKLELGERIPD